MVAAVLLLITTVVASLLLLAQALARLLAARLCGVPVHRFSIGFGPTLLRRRVGQTEWRLCWIPLGGFVEIVGFNRLPPPDFTADGCEYSRHSQLRRALVALAGPAGLYLMLAALATTSAALWGRDVRPDGAIAIADVIPGTPAERAGLQSGDVLRQLDGEVPSMEDIAARIQASNGSERYLEIDRDGEPRTVVIKPERRDWQWRIGVGFMPATERTPIARAVSRGVHFPVDQARRFFLDAFGDVIRLSGANIKREDFRGPIGIVRAMQNTTLVERRAPTALMAGFSLALILAAIDVVRLIKQLLRAATP